MNKIKINLQIRDNDVLPDRRMNDEYVLTGLTYQKRSYVEIGHYCKTIGECSDATVRRLLKKVEHTSCNNFFIKMNNKIYVNPSIKMLHSKNYSKRTSIRGNWKTFLMGFEWDYFCGVNFKWNLHEMTVQNRMEKFFEKLAAKYKAAEIRLFYACEKNPERNGYHVHFLLWTDHGKKTEIRSYTENHFRGKGTSPFANTFIERFDPKDEGIGYVLKEMEHNAGAYDYLYKNNA